jgi:ankyrin repeat protein
MLFEKKKPVEEADKIIKGGKTHTETIDENLIHSIAEGSLEKVKYYADMGADLTQTDSEGRTTPLRLATIRSNMEIVRYLVEEKKVRPGNDVRVLHMALMAKNDPKGMFLYHLKHGANINAVDKTLGTPLMITIRDNTDGDFAMAKWVIEQGADVAVMTGAGSAIHNAVEFGNTDIIGHLLKINSALLNSVEARGFTPLILAAAEGKDENIKYLVDVWKADVNFQVEVTPLLMAAQNRHISTCNLLIAYGADANACHKEQKCTALHLAASNEYYDIIQLLIDAGANLDCEDPRGYTPLGMAGTEGYNKCVEMLLKAGANPNHRAHSDNTTAIFHCAAKNRVGVVKLLLEYGADPLSTRYEGGETIADDARKNKHETMADILDSWVNADDAEERAKICHVCYKYTKGQMKKCSRCKEVWYCTAACQKKDWAQHKAKCVQK